jgi:hypothetical protein
MWVRSNLPIFFFDTSAAGYTEVLTSDGENMEHCDLVGCDAVDTNISETSKITKFNQHTHTYRCALAQKGKAVPVRHAGAKGENLAFQHLLPIPDNF